MDGQEEVQNIEMMASRSSGGELGDGVRAKRRRSVQRENVGEMKKVGRVMSEGRDVVKNVNFDQEKVCGWSECWQPKMMQVWACDLPKWRERAAVCW